MDNISFFIKVIEIVLYIILPIFIISTFVLIQAVKKHNYQMIKDAIKNPLFPNIDLGFFGNLQKEYVSHNKNKSLALLNKISFYVTIIGLILLFLSVIFEKLFRY